MNNRKKKIIRWSALAMGLVLLTSCTANFCSPEDKAHLMFTYDPGLTRMVLEDNTEIAVLNDHVQKLVNDAKNKGYVTPSMDFWERIDEETFKLAFPKYKEAHPDKTQGMSLENPETITPDVKYKSFKEFGFYKFLGEKDSTIVGYGSELMANWKIWVHQLGLELGIENVPDQDFNNFYEKSMMTIANQKRSCITLHEGEYGTGTNKSLVSAKSWKNAWQRGLIEGLLVYPIAALVEVLTIAFGAAGWGQVGAILLTTLIVRGILVLATLKTTIGTQKMSALQPERAKLQQKYPNSDTNKYEKQALAQAQMALYKKHKINPMGSILMLIVQFPVFIAVWGAMNGSAILTSDSVLGLDLSAQLGASMTKNFFSAGWWTAVVLFLIMGVSQFISSRLSTWINKKRTKNEVVRLGKNPAAEKQQSQSKMMMNVMFIMIIVMSWTLPAAMGIYWLAGALISIAQTLIVDAIMNRKKKKA